MKVILAPIDFSDSTSLVLQCVSDLARAMKAKIVLVHVIRPIVPTASYSSEVVGIEIEAEAEESAKLKSWQRELLADGLDVQTSELYGNPADCIRDECKRQNAELVVVGTHGHGAIYELLVGSTTADLLKNAPCPVLVVPVPARKQAKPSAASGLR